MVTVEEYQRIINEANTAYSWAKFIFAFIIGMWFYAYVRSDWACYVFVIGILAVAYLFQPYIVGKMCGCDPPYQNPAAENK